MTGAKEIRKIIRYPEGDVFITNDLGDHFWERFKAMGSEGIVIDPPDYNKRQINEKPN